ncbi:MAG TPA: hypothetical protein VJ801_00940 [Polyangia bacterium]|jgi:hypothetical protein|nr:hypothetical protein [Polyangia bacterium]
MRIDRKTGLLFVLLAVLLGVLVFQIVRPAVPINLREYELDYFSQSGEDGVIRKLFQIIKPTSHFVVDFGCSDGVTNSNSRRLIVYEGWSGLLMDGDHKAIERARKGLKNYPEAKIVEAWVYPGNVETLFEQHGVPKDVDLLSIDIDSNDYYVWKVIHDFRPKVVVIEFNSAFPPPQKAVVQFHPLNYWDGESDYHGASIQSLYELGKRKGYELVHCTTAGINLFFVDKKYFPRLGIRDNSPSALFSPMLPGMPKIGRGPHGAGHRPWDTYEIEKDGQRIKPYAGDLTWGEIRIPKKFVPLP